MQLEKRFYNFLVQITEAELEKTLTGPGKQCLTARKTLA